MIIVIILNILTCFLVLTLTQSQREVFSFQNVTWVDSSCCRVLIMSFAFTVKPGAELDLLALSYLSVHFSFHTLIPFFSVLNGTGQGFIYCVLYLCMWFLAPRAPCWSLAYYPQSFLSSKFNPPTLHWDIVFFCLKKRSLSLSFTFVWVRCSNSCFYRNFCFPLSLLDHPLSLLVRSSSLYITQRLCVRM